MTDMERTRLLKKWRAEANDLARRNRAGAYFDQLERVRNNTIVKTLRACVDELRRAK